MSASDLATVDRETAAPDDAFEEAVDTLTSATRTRAGAPGADEVQAPTEPPPAEWTAPLSDLDRRLAAAEARVSSNEGRATATEGLATAFEARWVSNEARVTATEAQLAEFDARLSTAHTRLDSTDSAAEAAHSELVALTERLAAVDARLGSVDVSLGSLDDQLTTLCRRATEQDRALEALNTTIATEVERHTTDALVDAQHSLQLAVNSIAQLALAMAESSRDLTEDVSAESATTLLDSFRVDLDAILAQLGFEPLGTTVGAIFDPHRHRALKRVATSDPSHDKAITRVIRDGYVSASTGRILLFADVEVSRHKS